MDLVLVDEYPHDAAYGACFLTRRARGDITEETPDGPKVRAERVILTDQAVEGEGRICVSESAVRHLAHKLGMVDGWKVEAVKRDNLDLRNELVTLSSQTAEIQAENRRFVEAAAAEKHVEIAIIALDGTEHSNTRAAVEATAKHLDLEPRLIAEAVPASMYDRFPAEGNDTAPAAVTQ